MKLTPSSCAATYSSGVRTPGKGEATRGKTHSCLCRKTSQRFACLGRRGRISFLPVLMLISLFSSSFSQVASSSVHQEKEGFKSEDEGQLRDSSSSSSLPSPSASPPRSSSLLKEDESTASEPLSRNQSAQDEEKKKKKKESGAAVYAWAESKLVGEGFHRTLSTDVFITATSSSSSSSYADLISSDPKKRHEGEAEGREEGVGKTSAERFFSSSFPSPASLSRSTGMTLPGSSSASKRASLSCFVECMYTVSKIMYIDPNQTWELGLDSTFRRPSHHLPQHSAPPHHQYPAVPSSSLSSFPPPSPPLAPSHSPSASSSSLPRGKTAPAGGFCLSAGKKKEESRASCEREAAHERNNEERNAAQEGGHRPHTSRKTRSPSTEEEEEEESLEREGEPRDFLWSEEGSVATEVMDSFVDVELPFFAPSPLLPSHSHARQTTTSPVCFSEASKPFPPQEEKKRESVAGDPRAREKDRGTSASSGQERQDRETRNLDGGGREGSGRQGEEGLEGEKEEEEEKKKKRDGLSGGVGSRGYGRESGDKESLSNRRLRIFKKISFNLPLHHRYDAACQHCGGYVRHGVSTPHIRVACCLSPPSSPMSCSPSSFSVLSSLKSPREGGREEEKSKRAEEAQEKDARCDQVVFQARRAGAACSSFSFSPSSRTSVFPRQAAFSKINLHLPQSVPVLPSMPTDTTPTEREEEEEDGEKEPKKRSPTERDGEVLEGGESLPRRREEGEEEDEERIEEGKKGQERRGRLDFLKDQREEKKADEEVGFGEEVFMLYFNVPVGSVEHLPLVAFLTTSSVLLFAVGTLCVLSFASNEEEEEKEEEEEEPKGKTKKKKKHGGQLQE